MKKSTKKQKAFEFGARIEVSWRDTSGSGAWHSLDDAMPEPPTVSQLGYFVGLSEDTLYLCQGLPNMGQCSACEGQVLGPTAIPLGCLLNIKEVRINGKKRTSRR